MSQTTTPSIHRIIAGRWSPRTFDADRLVEAEKLNVCLQAARWSSSCFGEEPWRFIVADRSVNPDGWKQMLGCLADGNQGWAQHAPVLILACAMPNFMRNDKANRWAQYDTGQAMMSLSLQAVAEGLITHPMGGFDAKMAAEVFHVPADISIMSVTALGYLASCETTEIKERSRKALQDIAFTSWHEAWPSTGNL